MQSRTDVRRQSIQLTGATVGDARRAEGWSVRWKRNGDGRFAPRVQTRYFLFQPSLPLIQATLVRGAFGADNTSASRLLPESAAPIAYLYEKRFSYSNYRKYRRECQGAKSGKTLRSFTERCQ